MVASFDVKRVSRIYRNACDSKNLQVSSYKIFKRLL
jgi:hypothetical protein